MILVLLTGFQVPPYLFQIVSEPNEASVSTIFEKSERSRARASSPVQFSVCVKDPSSALTMKTTAGRPALTDK